MAATFTIVDRADGTGATATFAGTLGGVVLVYVGKVAGEVGPLTFGYNNTRVGDGTLNLAVAVKGLYFAYALLDGVPIGVYYFAVTDGLDAVATRVRRAVCDTIRLLTIPPAANVYEQIVPFTANVKFPCVLATVDSVQESEETGLSTRDDLGRPVRLQIADRISSNDSAKLPLYEYWRQSIDRCFRNQQLAGVPESVKCRIEPYVIADTSLPQFDYFASGLTVRAICREPRGVGA